METIRSINANSLESYIVMHSEVVTGGQVITVSKVILLYEAIVTNSLLGNHRLVETAVLDLWQGTRGSLPGSPTSCRGPSSKFHEERQSAYLFQRVSVTVQRYNAVILHDSFPPGSDLWPPMD